MGTRHEVASMVLVPLGCPILGSRGWDEAPQLPRAIRCGGICILPHISRDLHLNQVFCTVPSAHRYVNRFDGDAGWLESLARIAVLDTWRVLQGLHAERFPAPW